MGLHFKTIFVLKIDFFSELLFVWTQRNLDLYLMDIYALFLHFNHIYFIFSNIISFLFQSKINLSSGYYKAKLDLLLYIVFNDIYCSWVAYLLFLSSTDPKMTSLPKYLICYQKVKEFAIHTKHEFLMWTNFHCFSQSIKIEGIFYTLKLKWIIKINYLVSNNSIR